MKDIQTMTHEFVLEDQSVDFNDDSLLDKQFNVSFREYINGQPGEKYYTVERSLRWFINMKEMPSHLFIMMINEN